MSDLRHKDDWGKRLKGNFSLFLLAACLVLVLGVGAHTFASHATTSLSPEVAFTDTSKSGLAIVPASCPSTPDYAGQCDSPPQQASPKDFARCGISTTDTIIAPGQQTTLNWIWGQGTNSYTTDGYWYIDYGDGSITGGIGNVGPSGSATVAPTQTTHYIYTGTVYYQVSRLFDQASTPFECDATVVVNPTTSCPPGYTLQSGQCIQNAPSSPSSCPIGYTVQGDSCVFVGCPTGYTQQGGICVFTSCPTDYVQQGSSCVFVGCAAQYMCVGNSLYYQDTSCNRTVSQACTYGCGAGACSPPPAPTGTLNAVPSIVKGGETSLISWSVSNVTSCTVAGTNNDSWTGASGNQTSSSIVAQTIYTLSCTGLDGSHYQLETTVNVVPNFVEH